MSNAKDRGKRFFDYIVVKTLQVGSTSVTALTASLAPLIGAGAAGTATASKVPILGTNKNLDTLVLADGGLFLGAGAGTSVAATAAELNKLASAGAAGVATASKVPVLGTNKNLDTLVIADGGLFLGAGAGTAISATAAEINQLHSTGVGSPQRMAILTFAETAGASLAATVTLPAGAIVQDVILKTQTQWNAATSAAMSVGDADAATGFINAVNLKTQTADAAATPAGISSLLSGAGSGAYAGKYKYYPAGGTITATSTKVGAGTNGRSIVIVLFTVPPATVAA